MACAHPFLSSRPSELSNKNVHPFRWVDSSRSFPNTRHTPTECPQIPSPSLHLSTYPSPPAQPSNPTSRVGAGTQVLLPTPHSHLISNNDRVLSTRQRYSNPFTRSISFELTALRGKCYRWPHFTDEEIKSLVKLPEISWVVVEGSHCALCPRGQPCLLVLTDGPSPRPPTRPRAPTAADPHPGPL